MSTVPSGEVNYGICAIDSRVTIARCTGITTCKFGTFGDIEWA
jgi:hypothetical protein